MSLNIDKKMIRPVKSYGFTLIFDRNSWTSRSNICFIVRSFPVFLIKSKISEYSFPMKTNACNVKDINIHHIKECLLLSCVASFEDWSNIFRTRSFTLCKNDLDFNDMSDSAMVLESVSSSSTINLSVCCANKPGGCSLTSLSVLTSITSSDFHPWEDHFSSTYHSE